VKIDEENNALIANGIFIKIIYSEPNPEDIDYTVRFAKSAFAAHVRCWTEPILCFAGAQAYGIHDAILVDNTGIFRSKEGLGRHLKVNTMRDARNVR